jgi:hypothetical protein
MLARITREDAETLALEALAFLVDSPEELARFLTLSGIRPAEMRARAEDRAFLAGVVDFLLGEEALLLRFCAARAVDSKTVHFARGRLSPAE